MSPVRSFYARSIHAILATIAINLGLQGVASAHPGHGITPDGNTPAHYLIEPSHGIGIAIILVATFAATFIICRRKTKLSNRTSD